MCKEFKEKNIILGKLEMASPTKKWEKYETTKDFAEMMEIYEKVSDEDKKPEQFAGAYFAKWLDEEKFSGNEDVKLPQIANEAEKLSRKAGIGIDFLLEETKHLIDSIEKYVKALKKAGI